VADEWAIALAVRDGDAAALKAALLAGGYLPASRADAVDADWALRLMRMATNWYALPGERRSRSTTPVAAGSASVPTASSGTR
jgi:hypothetical protein